MSGAHVEQALRHCNDIYINCTHTWHTFQEQLAPYVRGQDVIEIGCGANGGLSSLVTDFGAKSYIGIDIEKSYVEQSRASSVMHRFEWDDPLNVLKNRSGMVISSGVLDITILKGESYRRQLLRAISEATPSGQYTIHSALNIIDHFNHLFRQHRFLPVKTDIDSLAVYIKE